MKTRGLIAAAASAVLLLTAGCGSAHKVADGDKSPTTTSSSHGSTAAALTSDTFIGTVTKAQLAAKTSHVEMKGGAGGQTVDAVGDVAVGDSPSDAKLAMTMKLGSVGDIEMRLVDKVLYLDMGTLTGGKFAKIDLDDPSNPIAKSMGGLTGQLDPSQSLRGLEGAITSVKKSGPSVELDGVKAQPYTVVVDTAKMKGSLGDLAKSAGAGSMPKSLTYTYWVGSDNLPRKMTSDVAGSQVQILFTKWGEPVDVTAPAAAQITDKDPFANLPSSLPSS